MQSNYKRLFYTILLMFSRLLVIVAQDGRLPGIVDETESPWCAHSEYCDTGLIASLIGIWATLSSSWIPGLIPNSAGQSLLGQ